MKQEDKGYKEWLAEIRTGQPLLDNPEELTKNIMQRIGRTKLKRRKRKFIIGSWFLGVAAGIGLCLLLNETLFSPVMGGTDREGESRREVSQVKVHGIRQYFSLPANWENMSFSEKSSYCSAYYMAQRQQRQKRISIIVSKTD